MDVFVGKGQSREEALDALKDELWRGVWKDCVDLDNVWLHLESGEWVAVLKEVPGKK